MHFVACLVEWQLVGRRHWSGQNAATDYVTRLSGMAVTTVAQVCFLRFFWFFLGYHFCCVCLCGMVGILDSWDLAHRQLEYGTSSTDLY